MNILTRILLIAPFLIAEVLVMVVVFTVLMPFAHIISVCLALISVLVIIHIICSRQEGSYKVLWIVVVALMPAAGTVAYLLFGQRMTAARLNKKIRSAEADLPELPPSVIHTAPEGRHYDDRIGESLAYLEGLSGFPAAVCESAEYYSLGENYWRAILEELKKAEKFVFMEIFIVENGLMWNSMKEILAEKIKAGVDVRFIYDDLGSIGTFNMGDASKLTKLGIKWMAFNELKIAKGSLNNRTHRKMVIIDGRVAFSGGNNFADEYINEKVKFGHWKDIGFKITGPAVANYVNMFVQFWNAFTEDDPVSNEVFEMVPKEASGEDGKVLSYYDSPAKIDPNANNFYVEMLGNATEYAWFYTPYLMLGETLLDAFVRAAKRGVDVCIIMPGIPDKKMVFRLSRSFYEELLMAGVKIYEYTPGFVHAKASLYDDEVCTIGTVNLDYRSLYLHFENNSVFWKSSIIQDLKKDYLDTLDKCREIKLEEATYTGFSRMVNGFLRVLAPLL